MTAVAFYTTGDTDPACPSVQNSPTKTQGFATLASQLAPGHAHGVTSLQDAAAVFRRYHSQQPPCLFSEVHFLGHGKPDGSYIFNGRRDASPSHHFHSNGQWCSTDNSAIDLLLDTLAAVLQAPSNGRVRIFLHACWSATDGSGGGRFAQELYDGLRSRGVPHGEVQGAAGMVTTHIDCVLRGQQITIRPVQRTGLQVISRW